MAPNIAIPTVLILSLTIGTLTQLTDVAQATSDKAVKYSQDMSNAVDCAYQARALTECSPDLFSTDFKEQVTQTQAILADLHTQELGSNLKSENDLPATTLRKQT
jgi:hypothetical protein